MFLRKLKLIYSNTLQRYNNFSVPTFLISFNPTPNLKKRAEAKILWKMIYLISQITFIFLTQIYCHMNFITSSSISSQDFLGTLRSIFVNYFWRTFFVAHKKKMHISETVCKICLKELGILLTCRENFQKFLAACNSSKNTGLPQIFLTGF